MKLFSNLSDPDISIEEIAMQPDGKYEALEEKLVDFMENVKSEKKIKSINRFNENLLKDVCMDLFGIDMYCSCERGGSFGIITVNSPNSLSVANYEHYKSAIDDYVDREDPKKVNKVIKEFNDNLPKHGRVDLKNARLLGGFKGAKAKLVYGADFLMSAKFSVEELTAVFLHEVGHVFNEYLYSSQVNDYHTMLQSHSAQWKDLPPDEVGFAILKNDPVRRGYLTEEQATQIETAEEPILPADIAIMMYNTKATHIIGDTSNFRTAEVLADAFSARCGYGAALGTALHRIGDSWSIGREYTRSIFITVVILLLVTLSGFGVLGVIFLVFAVFHMISTFGLGALRLSIFNYPDDKARVENTLHLTIQRLRSLGGRDATKMLKDIKVLQDLTDQYPNNYGGMAYLMGARVNMHLSDIQRIMNNKLFVTSVHLKLMSNK